MLMTLLTFRAPRPCFLSNSASVSPPHAASVINATTASAPILYLRACHITLHWFILTRQPLLRLRFNVFTKSPSRGPARAMGEELPAATVFKSSEGRYPPLLASPNPHGAVPL